MDTSNLIDSVPKIECLARDRLFYNQYQWCVDFRIPNARILQTQAKTLEKYLSQVRRQWQYRTATQITGAGRRYLPNLGGSWKLPHDARNPSQLDMLITLAETLWHHKNSVKPVFYWEWIYLYTNEIGLISELRDRANITAVNVKQACITRERNTINRRDSNYSLRTYFKERRLSTEQKQGLANFLLAQADIQLSRSLRAWLETGQWSSSRGYYWFDHNDHGMILMLEMIVPGLIGNTQRIISINTQSEIEDQTWQK